MFSLDNLRGTRFFEDVKSEGKLEGKLEAIQGLLALGLRVDQIAQALGIEEVIVARVVAGETFTPDTLLGNNQS